MSDCHYYTARGSVISSSIKNGFEEIIDLSAFFSHVIILFLFPVLPSVIHSGISADALRFPISPFPIFSPLLTWVAESARRTCRRGNQKKNSRKSWSAVLMLHRVFFSHDQATLSVVRCLVRQSDSWSVMLSLYGLLGATCGRHCCVRH